MKIDVEKFKELLESRRDDVYVDAVVEDCMKIVYKKIFDTAMKQNIDELDTKILIVGSIWFDGNGDDYVHTTKPISKEVIVDKITNILKEDGYEPELSVFESGRLGQYIHFGIRVDNRKDVVDEID